MKKYYSLKDKINFNHYVIACKAHTSSSYCNALGRRGNYSVSYPSQTSDVILNALLFKNKEDAISYTENIVIEYICELRQCEKNEINGQGLKNIMDRDYRVMTLKKFLDRDRFYEEFEEHEKKTEAEEEANGTK